MKTITALLSLFLLLAANQPSAQSVAINTNGDSADSSAMLHISSPNKGFIMPRMSGSQRLAINNPAPGLLVFDTDRQTIFMFEGTKWVALMFVSEDQLPLVERMSPLKHVDGAFGGAIAIDGNIAVVSGAKEKVGNNNTQGAVHVYVRENGGWQYSARLTATDGKAGDFFGTSVAISGTNVVVGAPGGENNSGIKSGKAYVFQLFHGSWQEKAKLLSADGTSGDRFGSQVAIDGTVIAVGATHNDVAGFTDAGAVYVYHPSGLQWAQKAKLNSFPLVSSIYLGLSIDISGQTIVAGTHSGYSNGLTKTGSAFTYHYNGSTWTQGQELKPPAADIQQFASYGEDVAIYGDTILVGAPSWSPNNDPTNTRGRVYEFRKQADVWTYYNHLEGKQVNGTFGHSVDMNGMFRIIGDPGKNNNGVVHLYKAGVLNKNISDPGADTRSFGQHVGVNSTGQCIISDPFKKLLGAVFFDAFY